jgi:hypothetical protein
MFGNLPIKSRNVQRLLLFLLSEHCLIWFLWYPLIRAKLLDLEIILHIFIPSMESILPDSDLFGKRMVRIFFKAHM